MRALSTKVPATSQTLVDTCGTGGSGSKLFNVSTAAAFVAASAGAKVAKHGNRKMTSFSGSADVLEAAGVSLSLTPEQIATCIDDIGRLYVCSGPPLGHAFCRPGSTGNRHSHPHECSWPDDESLQGQNARSLAHFPRDWQQKIAEVLKLLGSEHAMVVHSDGLDEFRLDAPTHVVELKTMPLPSTILSRLELDLDPRTEADLAGIVADSAESSLALVKQSLNDDTSAAADIVALNAGAAIYVGGIANSLKNGVVMAQDAISSGQAKERLAELVRVTSLMSESS